MSGTHGRTEAGVCLATTTYLNRVKLTSTGNVVGGGGEVDLATIAQTVSAIGTLLLAALFGYQVTVFNKQVAVNRGTLDEMWEGRATHERPQVVVTAKYRHGTLVEVVISNIGRGDAKGGIVKSCGLDFPVTRRPSPRFLLLTLRSRTSLPL
jgi:hypothetical protein